MTSAKEFIDGDLIESFIDFGNTLMQEISTAVHVFVEKLVKLVEELKRVTLTCN